MQEDPLDKFKIANKRRDATVTIRGYVYQVNVTLLRWIALRPGEALALEAGEDIDKIQKALADDFAIERLLEGVKHREKRLTLRSHEAVRYDQLNRPFEMGCAHEQAGISERNSGGRLPAVACVVARGNAEIRAFRRPRN